MTEFLFVGGLSLKACISSQLGACAHHQHAFIAPTRHAETSHRRFSKFLRGDVKLINGGKRWYSCRPRSHDNGNFPDVAYPDCIHTTHLNTYRTNFNNSSSSNATHILTVCDFGQLNSLNVGRDISFKSTFHTSNRWQTGSRSFIMERSSPIICV